MIDEKLRQGNFTSSNVFRLVGTPGAAATYIKEKMYERYLGRSIEMGAKSSSMTWGSFLEKRVFDNLPMGYEMQHKKTHQHPKLKCLVGTTDFLVPGKKVSELKCFEPKNFASYVSALLTEDTEHIKKEHPKEYWQIVSNAMIHGVPRGEAIVYMPYESEMEDIRSLMQKEYYLMQMDMTPADMYYLSLKSNSELATLPDDSKFKNLNIFEFEIPVNDIILLTKKVMEAEKLLNNGV